MNFANAPWLIPLIKLRNLLILVQSPYSKAEQTKTKEMTCPRHWTLVTELKLECRIPDSLVFFSFPRVPFKFFLAAFFFVSLSSNI